MDNNQISQGGLVNKNSRVLKWLLIVSIMVVLNLFFNYAIYMVYKTPKFEDFCQLKQINIAPTDQAQCLSIGGAWNDYGTTQPKIYDVNSREIKNPTGYCDQNFTCQKNYQDKISLYNRNVFVVLVVLGILSIVSGFFLASSSARVSLGLSFGGVLSLFIGSVRYWSDMNDYLRVIILGIALVVLIILGVRKIKD